MSIEKQLILDSIIKDMEELKKKYQGDNQWEYGYENAMNDMLDIVDRYYY